MSFGLKRVGLGVTTSHERYLCGLNLELLTLALRLHQLADDRDGSYRHDDTMKAVGALVEAWR